VGGGPSAGWLAVRMGGSLEAGAGLGYGEGGGGFEFHGAGKEDVVFQVHVLAEVVLEFLEAGVEDAIAEADAEGRGERAAELADPGEQGAGLFVIVGEDGDGVGEEAVAADGLSIGGGKRALERDDVGKEDGFFLGEVVGELDLELGEGGVDVGELGVGGAVAGEDVGGELEKAGKLTAGIGVVFDDDVGAEELEGGAGPVGLREGGAAGGELEGELDGVGVKVDGGAGGGEGLVAATAIVDTKVLEYADGGGLVEGDIANGGCGGEELCGAVGCG